MKKTLIHIIIILITFSHAIAQYKADENELKAVLIEKFTKFIDWPTNSPVNNQLQPIRLTILGNNKYATKIDNVYRNYKIKDKPVIIQKTNKIEDIKDCDIIIITGSFSNYTQEIQNTLKGKSTLIITDIEELSNIAHIYIYTESSKTKFQINDKLAKDNGFKISYLLLKHAEPKK